MSPTAHKKDMMMRLVFDVSRMIFQYLSFR
jgi:hypothetical protein